MTQHNVDCLSEEPTEVFTDDKDLEESLAEVEAVGCEIQPLCKKVVRKRRIKKIIAITFPILNLVAVVLIVFFAMRTDGISFNDFARVTIQWQFLFAALLVIASLVIIDSWRWQLSMYTMTKRFEPFVCMRTYLLERHYNLLTPFYLGGKGYQLYYLHKHKFSSGEITAIAISNFVLGRIGYQLVTGLVIALFITRLSQLGGGVVVMSAVWTSVIWNVGITVGVLFMSFNKTIPQKLGLAGVWLLHKSRIIKDKQKATRFTKETLWRYRVTMRKLVRSPKVVVASIAMATTTNFFHFVIIGFIYASLFGWSWEALPILLLGVVLAEYVGTTVPIPGGTGAMELVFLSIFATVFGTPEILVALVLWKVFSYIIPILNGLPVIAYDNAKKWRRSRHNNS